MIVRESVRNGRRYVVELERAPWRDAYVRSGARYGITLRVRSVPVRASFLVRLAARARSLLSAVVAFG